MTTDRVAALLRWRKRSIEELIKEMTPLNLGKTLSKIIGIQNRSTGTIAELAGMNPATLHKILYNKMHPSRNILIRLSLTLELSFDETQYLLKCGSRAALSGNRERDLYIIDGIENKKGIADVNDALTAHGHPDLFTKD